MSGACCSWTELSFLQSVPCLSNLLCFIFCGTVLPCASVCLCLPHPSRLLVITCIASSCVSLAYTYHLLLIPLSVCVHVFVLFSVGCIFFSALISHVTLVPVLLMPIFSCLTACFLTALWFSIFLSLLLWTICCLWFVLDSCLCFGLATSAFPCMTSVYKLILSKACSCFLNHCFCVMLLGPPLTHIPDPAILAGTLCWHMHRTCLMSGGQ